MAEYPLIRREFAAGRLSYAKVRALTRIVTPQTEADLVEMATPMTAGQLERFAQAHRRVSEADDRGPRPARKLTWSPAGDLDYKFRAVLPAEAAAVVFQALRAARNDLEHPHDDHEHGDDFHVFFFFFFFFLRGNAPRRLPRRESGTSLTGTATARRDGVDGAPGPRAHPDLR